MQCCPYLSNDSHLVGIWISSSSYFLSNEKMNMKSQILDGTLQADRLIRPPGGLFIDKKSSVDRIIIAIFRSETSVKA
tara:strand:+ start:156 stop:389 length:234 start_codon:yes stop_codon:yes gene_type:complete